MPQANFIRNSIAYKEDGTQVGINEPRFESGKFNKAIMVEEGSTNIARDPKTDNAWWNAAPTSGIVWGLSNEWSETEQALKVRSYSAAHHGHSFYLDIQRDVYFTLRAKIKNVTNALYSVFYLSLYNSSNTAIKTNYIPEILSQYQWTGHYSTDYTEAWITYRIPSGVFPDAVKYTVQLLGSGSTPSEIYFKDIQLEQKPYKTSWQGYNSTRSPESLTIPTNILNPKQGTVELWVKVNDSMKYLVANRYPSIFYAVAGGGSGRGIWLNHHHVASNFRFQIRNENDQFKTINIPDSQVPNGWHHFAFSWDSNEAKLYLDGVLKGTMVSPYLPNTIQNIYVGCWGSANQINSLIDDLRISNRVRTQEEILETYTKGFYAHADYFTTYKHSFDTLNSEIYLPDNYYNIPWQDPVFNRTQEDVLEALRRIREWKENGGEFEELKGCLNVSDLMRIEYDTKYLSWILNEYYFTNTVSTKRWDMLGLPNVDDVNRIISNIQNIINSYYTHPDAPPLPDTMLTYSDINAIEENLFRIMEIIYSMKLSFQKSGMFKAAGRRMLPLKRG